MLAQIRPGAGRAKVIAMEVYLRDPAPDVRAAAAAGVVRAGGDTNLDDLYVLFKDNDPRPALAALRELDRVPSEEATKLVARLAAARSPRCRSWPPRSSSAGAPATTTRRCARTWTRRPSRPELRGMALVAADDAKLASLAADPKMGIWVSNRRPRGPCKPRGRAARPPPANPPSPRPPQLEEQARGAGQHFSRPNPGPRGLKNGRPRPTRSNKAPHGCARCWR